MHNIRGLLLDRSENKMTNRAVCYMEPRTVIRRTYVHAGFLAAIIALVEVAVARHQESFLRTPMSCGKRNQFSDDPPNPTRVLQTVEAGAEI
jgi:hypothetical protein